MNANNKKNKSKNKNDLKSRIIKRQVDEIESLKSRISKLEISCDEKDELINSVETMRQDFADVVDSLREKSDEYDRLVSELKLMRTAFNQEVFNGKWRIIKFLMR